MNKWEAAQEKERNWWGSCQNTFEEEGKQLEYAVKMGLDHSPDGMNPYSFDMKGKSVLDIGGGPASLLLKCRNVRGKVVDPMVVPSWVIERYREAGIEYERTMAETMQESGWDEVWIYNTLLTRMQINDHKRKTQRGLH